jgi:hypothetical protein
MPRCVLATAMATDPSGGGMAIATWVFFWPATASALGAIPVLAAPTSGTGPAATAAVAAWAVIATAVLAVFVSRDTLQQPGG